VLHGRPANFAIRARDCIAVVHIALGGSDFAGAVMTGHTQTP
jgi:hypothetical protein